MTNHLTISRILALWQLDYLSEPEVINWADAAILNDHEPIEELYTLSIKGPAACVKLPVHEFPVAEEFSFVEQFALRLQKTDLSREKSKMNFISWVSQSAMGKNINISEVSFGYELEHRLSYHEDDPMLYFEKHITQFLPKAKKTVDLITSVL